MCGGFHDVSFLGTGKCGPPKEEAEFRRKKIQTPHKSVAATRDGALLPNRHFVGRQL